MAKFVGNKIFWLLHDSKDVINIEKNILVIFSAICFGCRAKPYIGIVGTGLETHFFHVRVKWRQESATARFTP